jgi:WD40 repeat protein/tetratricopeptide (TPR) repeat protein
VWDAQTGQPLTDPLRHELPVTSAQFSPDGRRILTTSYDGSAWVWDFQATPPLAERLVHTNFVKAAQFSPDGKRIVTASDDCTLRVWDAQTGQALTQPMKHTNWVTAVQFSPDGTRIVSASADGSARVWDAQSGQPVTERLEHDGKVQSARFSPDGERIVTASEDGTARVWSARTGQQLTNLLKHHSFRVNSAEFSPDGERIVTASDTDRVWDARTGQPLTELPHSDALSYAQFSPDGRRIVTTCDDKTARIWDAGTGLQLGVSLQHEVGVRMAQFSPDGKYVVTASFDHSARVWDAQSRHAVTEPLKHKDIVWFAQFSPDSKRVVTASDDNTVRVWDALSGQALTDALRHGPAVVTANSGRYFFLEDPVTGHRVTGKMGDEEVFCAQFSPDGRRIVTASTDGTARVWDVDFGPPVCPFWLLRLAEALSGRRLNEKGILEPTGMDRVATIAQIRQILANQSDNSDWAKWGRWVLAERSMRTITPLSSLMPAVYIENRIEEGTPMAFGAAEQLAHGNVELMKRFPVLGGAVDQPGPLRLRASMHARSGQSEEAVVEFSKLVELEPDALGNYLSLAPLLASTGDLEGWRRCCAQMLARFGATNEPVAAAQMAKTALIVPGSGNNLDAAVELADRALTNSAGRAPFTNIVDVELVKGLAEYRRGHNAGAVNWMRKVLSSEGAERVDAQADYILAMAQQRSGDDAEASRTFSDGVRRTQRPLPDSLDGVQRIDSPDLGADWVETIIARLLLKEGRATGVALRVVEPYSSDPLRPEARFARDVRFSAGVQVFSNANTLRSRGESFARSGRWTNAVAEFNKAVEMEPDNHINHHSLAPLLVQTGDLDGYRRHCAQVLERFSTTLDPVVAERMAKDCLIIPARGIDLNAAAKLADIAVTKGEGHPYFAFFEFAKGLAEYRQGHFDSAADWMQKVLTNLDADYRDVQAYLVLAMAQYRSGKLQESRAALDNAVKIIDTKLPKLESGDIGDTWSDWIIAHALLKEAKELIK